MYMMAFTRQRHAIRRAALRRLPRYADAACTMPRTRRKRRVRRYAADAAPLCCYADAVDDER